MAIDKRISYAFGGTGGRAPGVGGGGGGGNGHPNRGWQTYAIGPAPAPKDERKNPFEETGQTKIEQEKIAKNVQELQDKVKELKEKYPLQEDEFDDPEFYVDLDKYMEDKDLYSSDDEEDWAFEDLKVKAPKTLTPRTKTIDQGVPHLEDPIKKTVPHYYGGIGSKTTYGFGPKGTQTYSQAVEDSMNRGFFDSGIGKVLKTIAPFAIPALLPTKLATPYSMYNQAKTISKYAKQFGITEDDVMAGLTSKSNVRDLLSRKTTTDTTDTRDDRDRGDGRSQALQKIAAPKADVITAGIEKFSPRQLDLVRQRYEQLQQVIQTGMYNGQRLNNNQLANLQNVSKQMEAFLVDPQKMMRAARGGLAGLNG